MKIHEYQAKTILAKYGVPVPRGRMATTVEEAVKIAAELGGRVVVKAQIHAGGRGKGGGVKLAEGSDQVRETAAKILGMTLITHQTDASYRPRAVPRHRTRPHAGQAGRDGFRRGRYGH